MRDEWQKREISPPPCDVPSPLTGIYAGFSRSLSLLKSRMTGLHQ
jgi:hypothetical protein